MSARTCSMDDCDRVHYGHSYCKMHWHRWYRHGDPQAKPPRRPAVSRHPIERILKRMTVDVETGCWLFAGTNNRGYGQVGGPAGASSRRMLYAHRVAYEHWVGPIPEGLFIDHVWRHGCRHRNCVNPDHLEPVTLAENNRRKGEAMRLARAS